MSFKKENVLLQMFSYGWKGDFYSSQLIKLLFFAFTRINSQFSCLKFIFTTEDLAVTYFVSFPQISIT